MNMRHCPPPPLSLTQLLLETMKQCDTLSMFVFEPFFVYLGLVSRNKYVVIKLVYCDRHHFSVK